MKNDLIRGTIKYLYFIVIINFRRLKYFFKKGNKNSYIKIEKDENFQNSIIRIDYYFEKLLWLDFPKIGKIFENGTLCIDTEKITFPYTFKVNTFSNSYKYIIEFNPNNSLNTRKIVIKKHKILKTHKQQKQLFVKNKIIINNKIVNFNLGQLAIKNMQLKIKHSDF